MQVRGALTLLGQHDSKNCRVAVLQCSPFLAALANQARAFARSLPDPALARAAADSASAMADDVADNDHVAHPANASNAAVSAHSETASASASLSLTPSVAAPRSGAISLNMSLVQSIQLSSASPGVAQSAAGSAAPMDISSS